MSITYQLSIIAEDDPYPKYKWLRDNDPAHYSERENVWVLTRYEDVSNAFRDWKTWSSNRRGNLLNDMPERVGKTLGTMDPPDHAFARGLVNKAFTPKTVADLHTKVKSLAASLSSAARAKGTIEFVADISAPFNAAILGAMFGVPDEDFIRLRHWLDDFFLREEAQPGEETKQQIAMRHLRNYLDELVEKRLAQGEDDLLTAMIRAEEDGRHLSREQVVVTTMTFLVAGFESTNNLFTNLTHALARHPNLYRQVKANTDLIGAFVEEGMRWDAAAQGFVRTPSHDVTLHGKVIPEDSQVLLHIGSANRDERQFENADVFDIRRDTKRHLGMGQGIHFCVGAPLGRNMAYTLFEELLGVSENWQIDLAQATRVTTPNFRGFSRLPLRLA
ncbi:MAG: cytochrome P450 [Anaerolineae bacterium]|nr:cytochrome P450 [Anaerolineae bacterium]